LVVVRSGGDSTEPTVQKMKFKLN